MKRVFLIILGVLAVVVLVLVVATVILMSWGFFEARKTKVDLALQPPKSFDTAHISTGGGQFTKATFLEEPLLGPVTDIQYEVLPGSGEPALFVVGEKGVVQMDHPGHVEKIIRLQTDVSDRVVLVNRGKEKAPSFLSRGSWAQRVVLFGPNGDVEWRYGSWWGIDDCTPLQANGSDGRRFVVGLNGGGGIRLLDETGREQWSMSDGNVWHVESLDFLGGGREQILHSNASGELVVRDSGGKVVRRFRAAIPGGYVSHFVLTRWLDSPKPDYLLVGGEARIYILGKSGERLATFEAPELNRFWDLVGTPLRVGSRSYYAVLAGRRFWHRTALYVYQDSGQMSYAEVLAGDCQALAPSPHNNAESLLVGCEGQVWEYTPRLKTR